MTASYTVEATLTNGSPIVTAPTAAFTVNVYPGSTLIRGGVTAVVKSVDGATQLTLEENWPGATVTGDVWITRLSPQQYSFAEINRKYSQALEAMARGFTLQSASSVEIGTGSKTLVVSADISILPGARVRIASRSDLSGKWMEGSVTAYSGASMTVEVDVVAGAGTFDDWNINLAGGRGATGEAGAPGADGDDGAPGADGAPGVGVPSGGASGQVLAKSSATDYDTIWITPSPLRRVLTANATYFVRTDGNDSNDGLTNDSGGAFLTPQKAMDVVATLDFNGFTVTIQIADGTYTTGFAVPVTVGQAGYPSLVIQGNAANPENVIISATSANAAVIGANAMAKIKDVELRTTTAGRCLVVTGTGAFCAIENLRFGASAWDQIYADAGSNILASSTSYKIVGNAGSSHLYCRGSQINCDFSAVELVGTPSFGVAYATAEGCGLVLVGAMSFTGAGTGVRFNVTTNSVINSAGAGVTALPGDTTGVEASGGVFV